MIVGRNSGGKGGSLDGVNLILEYGEVRPILLELHIFVGPFPDPPGEMTSIQQ